MCSAVLRDDEEAAGQDKKAIDENISRDNAFCATIQGTAACDHSKAGTSASSSKLLMTGGGDSRTIVAHDQNLSAGTSALHSQKHLGPAFQVAEAPNREIKQAVGFLTDTRVSSSSPAAQRRFLESKGLSAPQIDLAFALAAKAGREQSQDPPVFGMDPLSEEASRYAVSMPLKQGATSAATGRSAVLLTAVGVGAMTAAVLCTLKLDVATFTSWLWHQQTTRETPESGVERESGLHGTPAEPVADQHVDDRDGHLMEACDTPIVKTMSTEGRELPLIAPAQPIGRLEESLIALRDLLALPITPRPDFIEAGLDDCQNWEPALISAIESMCAQNGGLGQDAGAASSASSCQLLRALHTLTVILANQLKHLNESRYHRFSAANANMRSLLALRGARDVLRAIGFEEDSGGAFWQWRGADVGDAHAAAAAPCQVAPSTQQSEAVQSMAQQPHRAAGMWTGPCTCSQLWMDRLRVAHQEIALAAELVRGAQAESLAVAKPEAACGINRHGARALAE